MRKLLDAATHYQQMFDLGREMIDWAASIMPIYMVGAIQLIILKFPGVSRSEIVGVEAWSDAQQEFVHSPGWSWDTFNDYYRQARAMADAEQEAADKARKR